MNIGNGDLENDHTCSLADQRTLAGSLMKLLMSGYWCKQCINKMYYTVPAEIFNKHQVK